MVSPLPKPALAIDIGGTKVAAAVVDGDGAILSSRRVVTPSGPGISADDVGRAVLAAADAAYVEAGEPALAGVGIGCAGPMEWRAGEVSPVNIPAWRGFALRALVAEQYSGIPVRLHNDTLCLAAGEHWRGAGRGHDSMLGMVVSTGVGGGAIVGGRALNGRGGNAGHVGHIVVDPHGPPCPCGAVGCVEAFASGTSIAAWAAAQGWAAPDGGRVTAEALAEAARTGDAVAAESFRRAGHALGVGIASALATLDVGIVVIGGGVAHAGELVFGPLRNALDEFARLPFTRDVPVTTAELGGDAGLVGAAALIHRAEIYWPEGDGAPGQ